MSSGFLSLFPVDLPDHFLELRARAHDLAPAAEAAELEVRADAQHLPAVIMLQNYSVIILN